MQFTLWKQASACLSVCACAALSSVLSLPAHANAAKPDVETFFADPAIYSAAISPKGEHVAVLVKTADGGQAIQVRDTMDLTKGGMVTGTKEDRITGMMWVNENRLVFSIRPAIRDINPGNQNLYAIDRDGQNLHQLIDGDFRYRQESTGSHMRNRILPADYALYSSMKDDSDDIIVKHTVWPLTDRFNPVSTHLFKLNTKTGALAELPVGKSPENVLSWVVDRSHVPRVARSYIGGRCITHYRASANAEWEVLNEDDCRTEPFAALTFDGDDTLIVRADNHGYDALYRYDLKTRKREEKPMLALEGYDFRGSTEVDDVANKVVGIHYVSDASSTVWLDASYKGMQANVDAQLPHTINKLSCGTDCMHAPALLVTSTSDREPAQYYIYNVAKGSLVGFGGVRPGIDKAQMGRRDFYRFKARDGMSIPVYVTTPPVKSDKPFPAVVLVHGGPWLRVWSWEWESEAQFLASRGYLVIQPEFRGSTGFGFDLFHAGWKQWGQAMQDDLADAALWAVKERGADPKRIGIMGASYGGYATLEGLIKNPEIFRCGVEWAGVTDSNLMFSLAESDASDDTKKYSLAVMMGDPKTDGEMFKKYSPLENAAKLTQPLLIAHGAEDRRVPIAQASAFHDAVKETNHHVEWVVYNNEYHGWHIEKDNIDFWKRVDAFLAVNLMSAQ